MWLPVLLLALMASSSACPDVCQCRTPVVECRGHAPKLAQLDELPPSFVEFKIRGVEEEELEAYVGSMPNSTFLRRLRSVEVTNCTTRIDLHYLKWDLYREDNRNIPVLPNIRVLNITHNNLDNLPKRPATGANIGKQPDAFDSEGNQDSVDSTKSKYTSRLIWLCLASNNLDYISPSNFKYLEALEYLDLSNNALETLERSFDSLHSLQRLNLAGNKLVQLQAKWFKNLGKLVELDISRNKLTFISADTLQPLASLAVLKLAENPLIKRDLSLILGTGRRLRTVDASMIGLIRVPAALTRSVRTLKLAGNQLTSINSGDLDSYPLLRVLDLSNNRLMIIEEDALGRLDGLEELYLSGNILPSIPKSLPSGLNIFDLSQNAISALKVNDLQGLYLLKELDLSGNVISVIEGGSFRQLPALEKLDISDNPIKKLPSDTLSGPTNLMALRMSGLTSLETEKNQNQDTSFPILTLERLVILDVSRSPALAAQLMADNAALSACKSLQELDLSYSNVGTIRSDLAYVLPQLWNLNLNGNEWNCNTPHIWDWTVDWIAQHINKLRFLRGRCTPNDLETKSIEQKPAVLRERNLKIFNSLSKSQGVNQTQNPITTPGTVKISTFVEKQELKNTRPPAIITNIYKTTENWLSSTEGKSKISVTSTTQTTTVSESLLKIQDHSTKSVTKESKPEISSTFNYPSEKPVTVTSNKNELPYFSTPSNTEEYRLKISSSDIAIPTEDAILINLMGNNQEKIVRSTDSSTETVSSTTNNNRKVINDLFTRTSTESSTDTIFSTTAHNKKQVKDLFTSSSLSHDTSTVTNVPFTESSTSPKVDVSSTTQITLNNQKAVNPMKTEEAAMNRNINSKADAIMNDKKFAELSHSKMLLANDEPRVNNEPNSFAEELNSQATESGARTSESLTTGAHPGMLVLLGAAIGAAVALTVVLSRRATVKRRDRQYQRHENIEVHALTPTTELW